MNDKVCILTGATAGIGAAAAEELARTGATLVVVGRNRQKCTATVERIRHKTANPSVDFLLADLSSQSEIRRLAQEVLDKYPRLDVLVNNAGGIFMKRLETVDGLEMTFALNHLAYFLLTNLLVDRMAANAPARVINVSSSGHQLVDSVNFNDLQGRSRYRGFRAYGQSKLANLLFTYELARRLEDTGVTVNALHPGVVATNIAKNNFWTWHLLKPLYDLYHGLKYISPSEGARTLVYLATSPDVEGVTGQYFEQQRPSTSSAASHDPVAARRLWQLSEELTTAAVSVSG